MENEISAKIILLGDSGVGKTTISNWALTGTFNDQFLPTVGGNFISKDIRIQTTNIKLQIWDTAGEERYRSLIPMFYRDVKGAILIYSIKDKNSIQDLNYFVNSLNDRAPNVFKVLVGNKSDMADKREITFDEGQQYANEIHAKFFETSAKTGENIDQMLKTVAQEVYDSQCLNQAEATSVNNLKGENNSSCSC